MTKHTVHVDFPGRFVFIGFGSIGQGVLPLILRHIGTSAERITVVAPDERGMQVMRHYGVRFIQQAITPLNLRETLEPLVAQGDFVVNVSVDVSSVDLIKFCRERGALYLDTCIEPWPGGYTDTSIPAARRTNYALRETALALRDGADAPTAVLTHGANPGLVSHLVKQAMLNIAADTGVAAGDPRTREDWARLAHTLGIKVIHIAERDTQVSPVRKQPGEFVNTWSVDGFVSEGSQPAELGWGAHEKTLPPDGNTYDFGRGSSIFLSQPGAATRVRTWTPRAGHFHGFLITHG
ncbi:MAG: saccharopine dehydrogenase NADP-binding domain-containing protein, partial [Gammaproteobacteria bacterium]